MLSLLTIAGIVMFVVGMIAFLRLHRSLARPRRQATAGASGVASNY